MIGQLNKLAATISAYHEERNPTGDQLNKAVKNVSAILFYLTTERINAHKKYNSIMFNRKDISVAAQTVIANEEVPELYELRYILKAGYECLNAMRSNLVSIRKEREFTGNNATPNVNSYMVSEELEKEQNERRDKVDD